MNTPSSSAKRKAAASLAGTLVANAGALLGSIVAARSLAPADAGSYFFAVALVALVSVVARAGVDRTIVRLLPERVIQGIVPTVRTASASARIALVGAGIVGPSAALAWWMWNGRHPVISVLVGVWTISEALRVVFSEMVRAAGRIQLASAVGDALRALVFAFALIMSHLYTAHGAVPLMAVFAIATGASLFVAMCARVAAGGLLAKVRQSDRQETKRILRISLPLLLAGIFITMTQQGDVLVAGYVLTKRDIALYASCVKLSLVLMLPLVASATLMSPIVSQMWASERTSDLERRLRFVALVSLAPVLIVFVVFSLYGDSILSLFYGGFYSEGYIVLVILALGPLFSSATGLNGVLLMMTGGERTVLAVVGASALLGLPVMAAAGMLAGRLGLAMTSSGVTIVQNVLLAMLCRRKRGVTTWTVLSPRVMLDELRAHARSD